MPFRASIRPALRWAPAWKDSSVIFSTRASDTSDTTTMMAMATSGGSTIQGEIQASTARNSATKGRSTKVVRLAEAMKSRTDSKDLRLDENETTETGRLSMRR